MNEVGKLIRKDCQININLIIVEVFVIDLVIQIVTDENRVEI